MKKIKHKLTILILLSNTVLFVVITIAFNLLIPNFFANDAEKALHNEIMLIESGTSAAYSPTYLSGNISYLLLDKNGNVYIDDDTVYNDLKQYQNKLSKERADIGDFCSEKVMGNGTCYTYKTDSSYYVLTVLDREIDESDMVLVMYINIKPFLNYTLTLDIIIFLLYISVSVVMGLIGSKIGSMLDNAREAEKKFYQNSSHELKTPLMSIQGYAEGIQMKVNEPQEAAEVILRESERMTKLVEELLCISRIDANKLILDFEEVDIREVLYDCIRIAEPLANKKQCTIEPHLPETAVMVQCDEEHMLRAISNIIVNAVYHCDSTVTVTLKKQKSRIILSIHNDGEPITPDALEHIFDRFYTGHKGGTGIGLSITHDIIMLHKGKIEVKNENNGTVFNVFLPIK